MWIYASVIVRGANGKINFSGNCHKESYCHDEPDALANGGGRGGYRQHHPGRRTGRHDPVRRQPGPGLDRGNPGCSIVHPGKPPDIADSHRPAGHRAGAHHARRPGNHPQHRRCRERHPARDDSPGEFSHGAGNLSAAAAAHIQPALPRHSGGRAGSQRR
ncbi:hypothetical protein D9M71_708920 [compost metagenome]